MRVFGYLRVSTGVQEVSGLGLEAQRRAIALECERRGWVLEGVFQDAVSSVARKPGFEEALKRLASGDADVLLAAKLDRLARNVEDFVDLLRVAKRQGWSALALDLPVDTTTPQGEAMMFMQATFAQLERRLIGQRTREALAVKRAQGVRLGRPSGLSEELRLRIVQLAGERGYAPTARLLNEEGVRPGSGGRCWWASSVRSVVKSYEATT